MSNRAYLTTTDIARIYPGFQNPAFDSEKDWALTSAGCIPLLWLALFSDSDLTTTVFTVQGREYRATAPLTERLLAISRLQERAVFLNQMFGANGGLAHHLTLFADYLTGCSGKYLTMECEEIAGLYSDGQFAAWLRQSLSGLRNSDPNVRGTLIAVSTIMPERRFVTLEDARTGKAKKEDMWNYFRIMGESYLRAVPWG